MIDDIVTRLRNWHDQRDSWQTLIEAADEIELLRKLAHNLYEETKRCGTLHDTQATWDYEQWLEDND
jgi:hypothetical protein